MKKTLATLAMASVIPFAWSCATDGSNGPGTSASAGTTTSAGSASGGSTSGGTASTGTTTGAVAPTGTPTNTSTGSTGSGGALGQIPSLVNVNLQNVLNDLSVKLNIDRANVPINIQLPIQLAANVCGVSVNVLAVSTGGQANCTAKSAPQELAQVVQQQMAAGGSVGGGAQGGSTASTSGAPSSGAATGGASNTSANSYGGTDNTTSGTATSGTTAAGAATPK
jgi:hypothetical protein